MIRAICLNPNIDRSYRIDSFVPGMQYKRMVPEITAGGKGVNVARACSCLGQRAVLYCFTGGANGRALVSEMSRYCDMIRNVEIEGNSRETINIIDRTSGKETEIVEKGPSVSHEQFEHLFSLLEREIVNGDIVVCSGATIEGAPDDVYAQISAICVHKGAHCLLDTNGAVLHRSIGGHYAMWKPNQNELAELAGSSPSCDPCTVLSQIERIEGLDSSDVLVSLGAEGGMLVNREGSYLAEVPDVPVVSTIGCGDSVVAGYAVAMVQGMSVEERLRFSMACGVVNSASTGIAMIDRNDVDAVFKEIRIRKI